MRLFDGLDLQSKILPNEKRCVFADIKTNADFSVLPEDVRDSVIKIAENSLKFENPTLPASLFIEYRTTGNRSNYEAFYFNRRTELLKLALGEKIESKGRFLPKILNILWSVFEETTWVIPAHYNHASKEKKLPEEYITGATTVDLFSAATAGVVAIVYNLLSESFDAYIPNQINERLLYELDKRIVEPFLKNSENYWWTGEKGGVINNWNPWIISNLLTVILMAMPNEEKRIAMTQLCLKYFDNFLNTYTTDGGCDEGPAYWDVAGGSALDCFELIYDLSGGKLDKLTDPLTRAMGEYIMKTYIDGGHYIRVADCGKIHPNYKMIKRFGRRSGSKELELFANTFIKDEVKLNTATTPYRMIKDLWEFKDKSLPFYTPPKYSIFNDIQLVCMRSDKFFVSAKGGHNAENHNHNDVGSFIFYNGDKPVFIDAGVDAYTAKTFSAQRYEIWSMQSQYHNTPSINSVMQMQGKKFKAENFAFDSEKLLLSMDISKAYPDEAGVELWKRSFLLNDKTFEVTDNFELNKEGRVSLNLLCIEKPDTTEKGRLFFAEAGIEAFYDKSLECCVDEVKVENTRIGREWGKDILYRIRLEKNTLKEVLKLVVKSC